MKDLLKFWRRSFTVLCLGLALFFGLLYLIAGEDISTKIETTTSVTPSNITTAICDGVTLEQKFTAQGASLSELSVMVGSFGRENIGNLYLSICSADGTEILARQEFNMASVQGDMYLRWQMEEPFLLNAENDYLIRVDAPGAPVDNGVGVLFGNSTSVGKFEMELFGNNNFWINGEMFEGSICCEMSFTSRLFAPSSYWIAVSALEIIAVLYCLLLCWKQKNRRVSRTLKLMAALYKARFLLKQLVSRDFKSKYQRSYLGILWSLFNPLLTMLVQYLIFGTLFKSAIENFAVYLMVGIVVWNFFGETTSLGLSSITGNFSLISKVYVPKYVFPLSKLLCCSINMALSLIPLLIFVIASGLPITKAYLLLPIVLVLLAVFCYGVALLLSTSMVFFRDTQFLWSVVVLLWMYVTPIFYPDSIIPAAFQTIYRMNPLYQFITFTRTILIGGVSPDITAYLACLAWALGALVVGLAVFKKNEDRFVFYI